MYSSLLILLSPHNSLRPHSPLIIRYVNSGNHVNSVNSVNSVNIVNSINSVNSYSAVLPPSPMVFFDDTN